MIRKLVQEKSYVCDGCGKSCQTTLASTYFTWFIEYFIHSKINIKKEVRNLGTVITFLPRKFLQSLFYILYNTQKAFQTPHLKPSFDLPPMYREAELSASAGDVPSQVGRESALLPPFSSIQGDAHPNCEVIFFYSVY